MSGKAELRAKLRRIAEELEKDLDRTQVKGRTLVLKIKLHTYEVLTRQVAPPKAINIADDLFTYALPMFSKLEREIPGMRLRLMGLRCTHLVSTKKGDVDFFGMRKLASTEDRSSVKRTNTDDEGWQIWPEEEFEQAARQERQEEMEEAERLSQEQQDDESVSPNDLSQEELEERNRRLKHGREIRPNPKKDDRRQKSPEMWPEAWACPICGLPQPAQDREFNDHIDYCLSKQTIKEAAKASSTPAESPIFSNKDTRNGKRKGTIGDADNARKKFFFGT